MPLASALCRRGQSRKTAPGAQQRARRAAELGRRPRNTTTATSSAGLALAAAIRWRPCLGQSMQRAEPERIQANTVTVCSRCRRQVTENPAPVPDPRRVSVVASRLRRRCHGTAAPQRLNELSRRPSRGDGAHADLFLFSLLRFWHVIRLCFYLFCVECSRESASVRKLRSIVRARRFHPPRMPALNP